MFTHTPVVCQHNLKQTKIDMGEYGVQSYPPCSICGDPIYAAVEEEPEILDLPPLRRSLFDSLEDDYSEESRP